MPQSTIYRRPPDEQRINPAPNIQTRSNTERIAAQNQQLGQQLPLGQSRASSGPVGRVPQGNTHSSALGLSEQQSQHVSQPHNAALERGAMRRATAGDGIGPAVAHTVNALDYTQGTIRGGGRVAAGAVGALANQIAQGASTGTPRNNPRGNPSPRSNPQGGSATQQVPNSPVPLNWWQGGSRSTLGRTANPGQPQMTHPPGTNVNLNVEGGTAIHHRGTGNDQAAREGLFASIDQRTADGRASAMGRFQREQAGGRQHAGPDPVQRRLREIGQQRQSIQQQIESGMNTTSRGRRLTVGGLNALNNQLNSLNQTEASLMGDTMAADRSARSDDASIQRQLLSNQGSMMTADIQGQNQMAGIEARINDPLNQARAQAVQQELSQQGIQMLPPEMPDIASLPRAEAQQAMQQYQMQMVGFQGAAEMIAQHGGDVQAAFAEANAQIEDLMANNAELVNSDGVMDNELLTLYHARDALSRTMGQGAFMPRDVQGFADGGLVGAEMPGAEMPGMSAPPASIQQYQQYVQTATQMGIEPVQFEEFTQMMAQQSAPPQQATPEMQPGMHGAGQVMGFAEGGLVPGDIEQMMGGQQVDGGMVMDADPNAPVDSIPAMIDGEQPAALDSGEFVIPADVVLHYGTEKLKKMIDAARGGATGAQQRA